MKADDVIGLVIIIGIVIVIFLICREIVTWYFKINKIIENQEEANKLHGAILKQIIATNPNLSAIQQSEPEKKTISGYQENEQDRKDRKKREASYIIVAIAAVLLVYAYIFVL